MMTWLASFTFVCHGSLVARSVQIEAETLTQARRVVRREFPEAIQPRVVSVSQLRDSSPVS